MEKTEIVVVGGGVIGAAVARALCLCGHGVVLVERGAPGGEASGAAAGILGALSETEGDHGARLGMRSLVLYRELVAELGAATAAAIDYRRQGTIRVAHSTAGVAALRDRCRRANRVRAQAVSLDAPTLERLEPLLKGSGARAAVLFPEEARIDGGALTAALLADLVRRGGVVRAADEARRLVLESGRVVGVETGGGPIACDAVVDAAGAWAGAWCGFPDGAPAIPVEPLRGQMVVLTAPRPGLRHILYAEDVYAVSRRDGRLLLGSTRERVGYRKAVTAGGVGGILSRAFRLAPALRRALGGRPVRAWWSGLRPLSADGLPVVGFWPGVAGYALATGHGRNGVLLAPVTAEVITAAFGGRHDDDAERLSPARFAGSAGGRVAVRGAEP